MARCNACGLLCRLAQLPEQGSCPRCGGIVSWRKPHSLLYTSALLLAAAIAYIPANLLPILHSRSLFGASSDTILSGIVFLWVSGSWPLALIVFFASIMVPLVKLVAILLLILASKRRMPGEPVHWAALYRVVERIGRWSMLDVYVVALLVTLVRLRGVAYIEPAPGAAWFALVVVLTMLAARSFDPRLLWDARKEVP
jgi:paraquat-inducible protein A